MGYRQVGELPRNGVAEPILIQTRTDNQPVSNFGLVYFNGFQPSAPPRTSLIVIALAWFWFS